MFPDLPKFLRRNGKVWPWDAEKAAALVAAASGRTKEQPLPPGLRWAAKQSEEDGFAVANGVVPRRWANEVGVIASIARSVADRQQKAAESLANFKAAMAEKKAMEPKKAPKPEFGTALRIVAITGTRKPGTGAATRFEAMKKFVAANPNASLAEVMAATGYRKDDYNWDLARNNIKVDVR